MNTWNHRVLATKTNEEVYFQVHEIYYDNKVPTGYTLNPISIGGSNLKEIKWQINRIKECLKNPILWAGDKFPQEYKEDEEE